MSEFDIRVDIHDPKTGKVVKHQPYRLEISREEGATYWRDGIAYHPDGTPKEKPIVPSIMVEPKQEKPKERNYGHPKQST